ncbi:nuclear transport factor 2 family protein [Croceivirga thetidis]|uniref:Nuclear transport factor 2 family protein n=1 Tax=Croceivirga thetidis TaxID=2721623 RepID=A0ABX1GSU4_9FLAO|nr:nuclear transport factor 2 family protein [Croceivirga thetidis]NKI31827.1 hypothetical protein [Croceivirga thetidis]
MKYPIIVLTVFLVSCTTKAQNPMENEIKTALGHYLEAGDTNNAEQLRDYLHTDFRVLLFDATKDQTSILNRETYVKFIDQKKFGGYPRTVEIHAIDTIGENMATVKVTLTSPGKPTLKNFYSLVKTANKWAVAQDFVVMQK